MALWKLQPAAMVLDQITHLFAKGNSTCMELYSWFDGINLKKDYISRQPAGQMWMIYWDSL